MAGKGMTPILLEVRLKDGQVLKKRVDALKGSPENPLSLEECLMKFDRNLAHGARPISRSKVKEAKSLVEKLEELDPLAPLTQCFC
jgi:2-methylcitrate dehydratase PrpD